MKNLKSYTFRFVFSLILLVFILLMLGNAFYYLSVSPPLQVEGVLPAEIPAEVIASIAGAIVGVIGLVFTVIFSWREDRRKEKKFVLEVERQRLEIEKLRLQLEVLQGKSEQTL